MALFVLLFNVALLASAVAALVFDVASAMYFLKFCIWAFMFPTSLMLMLSGEEALRELAKSRPRGWLDMFANLACVVIVAALAWGGHYFSAAALMWALLVGQAVHEKIEKMRVRQAAGDA